MMSKLYNSVHPRFLLLFSDDVSRVVGGIACGGVSEDVADHERRFLRRRASAEA